MNIIKILVENKKARCIGEPLIICGNSDYVIEFTFDEEWAEHSVKTARFSYGNKYTDVVFTGNGVQVPVLQRVNAVEVGVYAGELHTTTAARIDCKQSILCKDGLPVEPTPDVYSQIIGLIESGMLKGEQGEKGEKGEKGDAGSIKFIPVNTLPAANIDESAIYLVPIEGSEDNRYTEYAYINGAWETLGAITVQVDHSEYVKFIDIGNGLTVSNSKVIVYTQNNYGLTFGGSGLLMIKNATDAEIEGKGSIYKPITPKNIDHAVKVGITTNTETLTDEEKTSACDWLGAVKFPQGRTGALTVYADGSTSTISVAGAGSVEGGKIVRYSTVNTIRTNDPIGDLDCVNKQTFESKIAELIARIEALETKANG